MLNLAADVQGRAARVLDSIESATKRTGRSLGSVTLVAVSKSADRVAVDAAYNAGIRHFGENRPQDASAKFLMPLPPDARLHMIGQLQTNKASIAARLFDIIESVDRRSLIDELQKQGAKLGKRIPVLLQVNIAAEAQKAGCDVDEALKLVDSILLMPHLELRGLMTIAPLVADAEEARPVFRGLRALRNRLETDIDGISLPVLSMGMSNDFEVAIEEGATHVRVGRAIFGE
jgi:pyridoxal phosphate enzyme (YggS family)